MQRTLCASLLGGLLAALILPSPCRAATTSWALPAVAQEAQTDTAPSPSVHRWSNLARVRQGDGVIVTTRRSRVIEGRFVGYTADALSFTVDGEPVSIDREDVTEVQWREKSHKIRNAVLTCGVSLLVGLVAGSGAEASSNPDEASHAASAASLEAGSATYEAMPKHAVIYRAPPPTR